MGMLARAWAAVARRRAEGGAPRRSALTGGGLEAGMFSRRLSGFVPSTEHINSLLAAAGDTMTARARWLARNNGYARKAVRAWGSAAVGAGIKPSSRAPTPELRQAINELWLQWTDESDAEGITDLYGQQRRSARESFIAGECFFRLRPRRAEDGLSVPLQLQMLPAEMLALDKTEAAGPGGRQIRQGIEFDPIGRRVAYWFYRRHPGDSTDLKFDAQLYSRVPAEEVIHVFDPLEGGQVRGVSDFTAAVVKIFQLDAYDDAELGGKKLAAHFAGFIEETGQPGVASPLAGESATDVDTGTPLEITKLEPETFQKLRPGEKVTFAEPKDVGSNYEAFQYRVLLAIAAALSIPYYVLTMDVSKANYSSLRAALVDFRREVEAFQHSVLVFQLCRKVWAAWFEAAVLAGALPISASEFRRNRKKYLAVKWIPPKWEWVDPWKDRQAERLAVDAGFKPRSAVIEAEGEDPEDVDAQIAADQQRERDLGLQLNGDRAKAPVAAKAPASDPMMEDGTPADNSGGPKDPAMPGTMPMDQGKGQAA